MKSTDASDENRERVDPVAGAQAEPPPHGRSVFAPPDLDPSLSLLEAHFESARGRTPDPIRNYHRESPVSDRIRDQAVAASVLLPIIERPEGLQILLTRRHHAITYPGQICFPGGRADATDGSAEATALRETHEEIGLTPSRVRILGRLGIYHTQSGYRITPIVGLIRPPFSLSASPHEVDEILEIPLATLTRSSSYRIWRTAPETDQAFFAMEYGEIRLTGPTVCLAMGFYEALAATHTPPVEPRSSRP
ncbi:MAG: CoA pyrophosphatase [Myxococcota bacterium]|nr:CoA pyrophosphatase [Myxococcota bacterium]